MSEIEKVPGRTFAIVYWILPDEFTSFLGFAVDFNLCWHIAFGAVVVYADGFIVIWIKATLKGSHFSRATLRLKILEFYLVTPTLDFSSNSFHCMIVISLFESQLGELNVSSGQYPTTKYLHSTASLSFCIDMARKMSRADTLYTIAWGAIAWKLLHSTRFNI